MENKTKLHTILKIIFNILRIVEAEMLKVFKNIQPHLTIRRSYIEKSVYQLRCFAINF